MDRHESALLYPSPRRPPLPELPGRVANLQRVYRLPSGIGPAGEEIAEGIHLQHEVPVETALEDQIDAGDGGVEAPGRFGAMVEGVEPVASRDRGPATSEVATPAAELQVGHRPRAETED